VAVDGLDGALTPAALREQWLALLARPAPAPGKRQVAFLPLETVLSAMGSLVVVHRHYGGGGRSDRAPSPVPELAALFKRPPTSIIAKMANVDGSRPHGARIDLAVGTEILGRVGWLVATYLTVFEVARSLGIGPQQLPDFLGIEATHAFVLLGQDEIEPDLDPAVGERADRWQRKDPGLGERETRRLAEVYLRIGQHKFAGQVLRNYGHACAFCGMKPPQRGVGLMRASHIKPWRVSDNRERLDPANGLAACPTHDVAFDRGLLMVNGGLRVHVAEDLRHSAALSEPLAHAFGRPPLRDVLDVPQGQGRPGDAYLRWHREHVWSAASA
jgi:putative restriction endonuclease